MLVSAQHKALLVDAVHAAQIRPYISSARDFTSGGVSYLAMPHRLEETKVLRNLGFNAPSPIEYHYHWPHKPGEPPYEHQKTTAAFLTLNRRAFVLSDFRTGKTLAADWAADYLMSLGLIRKVLIVAPLNTLEDTHQRALHFAFPHRTSVVLHGSAEKRMRLLRGDFDFFIINHDGIGTILKALQKRDEIDLIILDEGAKYRNANTRWADMNQLIKPKHWVWHMTANPTPNEPPEAYAQARLVNPSDLISRYPSYRSFQMATMMKVSMFKWVPLKGAMDRVYEILQPAIRFTKEQCFTLPPTRFETMNVALTPVQKKAYKEMMDDLQTLVGKGTVTAMNEGVKLMKIMQIVSGVVYDEQGRHQRLDCQPRLDAVVEIIEENRNKVVVLVPFKGNLKFLIEALAAEGISSLGLSGDTAHGKRQEIFDAFRHPTGPKVLVAHPDVIAHGSDLTVADTIVFWVPYDRPEIYFQVRERIGGPRQKFPMSIIQLAGTPVEKEVYGRLERKEKLSGVLLSMVANNNAY